MCFVALWFRGSQSVDIAPCADAPRGPAGCGLALNAQLCDAERGARPLIRSCARAAAASGARSARSPTARGAFRGGVRACARGASCCRGASLPHGQVALKGSEGPIRAETGREGEATREDAKGSDGEVRVRDAPTHARKMFSMQARCWKSAFTTGVPRGTSGALMRWRQRCDHRRCEERCEERCERRSRGGVHGRCDEEARRAAP